MQSISKFKEKIQGTQTDQSTSLSANESVSWPGNNTAYSMLQSRFAGSLLVWNQTNLLTSNTHYVTNSTHSTIYFLNVSDTTSWADTFNITYNYNFGGQARNSSGFGLIGLNTMAQFVPTVAIVAAAAIVIGVILLMFGRKKEE